KARQSPHLDECQLFHYDKPARDLKGKGDLGFWISDFRFLQSALRTWCLELGRIWRLRVPDKCSPAGRTAVATMLPRRARNMGALRIPHTSTIRKRKTG